MLSNVSFASFASFVEDYQRGGSISLRVAGWATPHPWQARAKQMSHCHAKGSPLTCNVSLGTLDVPSFEIISFFFLETGVKGEDNVRERIPSLLIQSFFKKFLPLQRCLSRREGDGFLPLKNLVVVIQNSNRL